MSQIIENRNQYISRSPLFYNALFEQNQSGKDLRNTLGSHKTDIKVMISIKERKSTQSIHTIFHTDLLKKMISLFYLISLLLFFGFLVLGNQNIDSKYIDFLIGLVVFCFFFGSIVIVKKDFFDE
jgi:hypothetical protein